MGGVTDAGAAKSGMVTDAGAVQGAGGAAAAATPAIGSLDTTNTPVGLWLFDDDLTDSSGNGLTLTAEAGTASYTELGGKTWIHFDGALRLIEATTAASLAILGDMTCTVVMKWLVPPSTTAQYIVNKGDAGDAAENTNANYVLYQSSTLLKYLHEYGVGTNSTIAQITTPTTTHLFSSPFMLTMVRDGTNILMYIGAQLMSTTSVSGQTPTGGGSGDLYIGDDSDGSDFLTDCLISGVKITASALSAAQVKAEYELVFGG